MKQRQFENALTLRILEEGDLPRLLPKRDPYAHKGDFGKVALLCGSVGYTGAAALASLGALRCGSGLVYTLVPEAVYPILACKLTEAMVFPLSCDKNGQLRSSAKEAILHRLSGCDAGLLGPGLGRSEELNELLWALVKESKRPLILDADGLNAFGGHIDRLRDAACPLILTPHDGEFQRLLSLSLSRTDLAQRCRAAAQLAKETGAVVLLKGHRTVITDGESFYLNEIGNPGMATGGSGDVLAGMILSFLGQGLKPLEAAALGAWLHGAAGDDCREDFGPGLLPGDLPQAAARRLRKL